MRIAQILAFVGMPQLQERSGGYQALCETPTAQDVEATGTSNIRGNARGAIVSRLSTFYAISFLCNALLVLLGCAGWQISSDRDSNQTTKNTSRFISATAYSVPALATSGLLLFWLHRRRASSKPETDSALHVKLFLFTAASNALAAIFMLIFTMIFDDPETRFGTGDDCRNALIPMIIVFHLVSFGAALTAVYILLRGPKTSTQSLSNNSIGLRAPGLARRLKTPLQISIPIDHKPINIQIGDSLN